MAQGGTSSGRYADEYTGTESVWRVVAEGAPPHVSIRLLSFDPELSGEVSEQQFEVSLIVLRKLVSEAEQLLDARGDI